MKTQKQYSGSNFLSNISNYYYSASNAEGAGRLKEIRIYDTQNSSRFLTQTYSYYTDNNATKGFLKSIALDNGYKTLYKYLTSSTNSIPGKVIKYDGSTFLEYEAFGPSAENDYLEKYVHILSKPYLTEYIAGSDTLRGYMSEIFYESFPRIAEIDINGYYHDYEYDFARRLKYESHPGSFGDHPMFEYWQKYYSAKVDYKDDSNKVVVTNHFNPSPNSITKKVTVSQYDAYGNPRLTYVNGELKNTTEYTYLKQPYTVTDGENRILKTKYDFMTRPLCIYNNDGTTRKFEYSEISGSIEGIPYFNSVKIIDEKNNYHISYFDSLGNIIAEVKEGILKTIFKYNNINQLIETTTPNNKKTIYEYDGFGNISRKISPDEGIYNYSYDKWGNLRFKYNSNSYKLTYFIYDLFHRLTVVGFVDFTFSYYSGLNPDILTISPELVESNTSNWIVKNLYDKYSRTGNFTDAPNVTISDGNFKGRLAATGFRDKTTNAWSYKVYDYDALGHVDRLIQKFDTYSALHTITNQYDHLGDLTYQNIDGQYYIWYKYDAQGRLAKCVSNFFNIESTANVDARYTYNKADQIKGKATLNSSSKIDSLTYSYNARGWLSNILKNGGTFQESITYEANGNVSTQTIANKANSWPNLSFSYIYDFYDRLDSSICASNAAFSEGYSYNNDGAITSKIRSGMNIKYIYPTYSNKLSSITVNGTSYAFSYDASGNFLSNAYRKVYLSNYDHRNLPLSESAQYSGSTLYYDDNGNRIAKLFSGTGGSISKEYYLRDHTGRELAIYDLATGKIKFVNLYGVGLIGRAEIY